MRVEYDEMVLELKNVLIKKGVCEEDALLAGKLFANNSLDGVHSQGINRFVRVLRYIEKGFINVNSNLHKVSDFGAYEIWDGDSGLGVVNAYKSMERAISIARENGIGLVALKNTSNWMRGGSYGWQSAEEGCVGICWTNTRANMPAWGGDDNRIGNNPFILSIPKSDGNHVVIDCAMAQFNNGKIQETLTENTVNPLNENFSGTIKKNNISSLPIGYWKGSGLAIALDLIGAVLSGGNTTTDIRLKGNEEINLTQVFIAIDQNKFNDFNITDAIINNVIEDIKSSKTDGENNIYYPGEIESLNRKANLENGIPVVSNIWESIINWS